MSHLLRLPDTTATWALSSAWTAELFNMAPLVRSLTLCYRDVPGLEHLLGAINGWRDDQPEDTSPETQFARRWVQRKPALEALLAQITQERAAELKSAEEVSAFLNLLRTRAPADRIEPLYAQLPSALRGRTELGYGNLGGPLLRYFERIAYATDDASAHQSLLLFAREQDGQDAERAPVLNREEDLRWKRPLADPQLDQLFSLSLKPAPAEQVVELLGLKSAQDPRLSRLFSSSPVPKAQPWKNEQLRVRYFGHACVLVEYGGISILVDPLIPGRTLQPGPERFSFEELPERIDYVLITHGHMDHFHLSTLLRLRHRIGCLVVPRNPGLQLGDPSLKLLAQSLGFAQVQELDVLESVKAGPLEMVAVPFLGEHGDLLLAKSSWLVRSPKQTLLFAADSKCLDERLFQDVRQVVGAVDTVFVGTCSLGNPVHAYYPQLFAGHPPSEALDTRLTDGASAEEASRLLQSLKASRVVVYALGLESWIHDLIGGTPPPMLAHYRQEAQKLLSLARAAGVSQATQPEGSFESIF